MSFQRTKVFGRSGSSAGVMLLYVGASVVGLVGVGLLVDNIIIFRNTIIQYVAQGYPYSQLVRQLLPSQLLPGVFESVAVYGGIALILFGVARINQKVASYLKLAGAQIPAADAGSDEHGQDGEGEPPEG